MSRAAIQASLALAVASACAANQLADAAQWSMQPVFQMRTDFNTNRRLQVTSDEASGGLWLTLDSAFARATETGDLTVRPRVEVQRYSQDTALNAVNSSLQLAARHLGERSAFSAQAGFARDSTLTSELAETGIVDSSTYRQTLNGSVTGGFNISQLHQVSTQLSYAKVEYPNGERFGLTGYRYPSLAATYAYAPTTLMSLSLTAFGDLLTAPDSDYRARELGVRVGIDRSISERLRVSASAGVSQTHSDEQGFLFFGFFIPTAPAQTAHGSVWSLRVTRLGDLSQWSFAYDRNVQPSGVGVLVRRETLNLTGTRHLSSQLNATLSLQRFSNDDFSSSERPDDRQYLTGDAGLEWRLSPQTAVTLTAGYSQARLSAVDARAVAWRSAFGIRWTPNPWSASR